MFSVYLELILSKTAERNQAKEAGGQKFLSPNPSLFAHLLGLCPPNFWTDGFFGGQILFLAPPPVRGKV